MEKLVSIVIPVLNRADTLPRLFASLQAVTYPNVELIFVDNGSTDGSVQLIEQSTMHKAQCRLHNEASPICSAQCSHHVANCALCIVHCALNVRIMHCAVPGAAAARNVGLAAAQGEYISFFDSDDEMGATFIEDMVKLLENPTTEAGTAELAVARTRKVFPDGHTEVRARGGKTVEAHIIAQGLNTASWVARTELVRRIGGWNESLRYWDDYELGVRLLMGSRHTVWSDNVYHRTYEYDGPRLSTTAGQLRVERSKLALEAIEQCVMRNAQCVMDNEASPISDTQRSQRAANYALRITHYALNLRRAIVRGQLEREGLDARAIECHGVAAQLLRLYTRWGGRGAWRVALFVLRNRL